VPWQQVLHAAVRRGIGWGQGHVDYTYSKISRRQQAVGAVIVPALRRPVPAVAVVVDTSGSIDDGLLAQAMGEVKAVLASLAVPDSSVTVLAVDAAVHTVQQVRDVREVQLTGGGGTDMGAGITGALACRPSPQSVIVLTDGYTPWPPVPAPVPVIVGVLGRHRDHLPPTPDWVQRVEVVPDA
jgi:predicted metal-dependent peptidase